MMDNNRFASNKELINSNRDNNNSIDSKLTKQQRYYLKHSKRINKLQNDNTLNGNEIINKMTINKNNPTPF
jgi:hypothetical protein